MKILSVFWAREVVTGAHERLLHLLRGLADRGHEVVLSTKTGFSFDADGLNTIELREGWIPSNKLDSLRALLVSKKAVPEEFADVDIVVCFGLGGAVPGIYLKHILHVPLLLGLRSYPIENMRKKNRLLQSVYRLPVHAYLTVALAASDRVVLQIETQKEKVLENHSVPEEKVGVIRNNTVRSLEEGTDSRGAKNLLFVGTINYRKGIDCLLKAFGHMEPSEDVHLHIAGTGPMKEWAESYVAENELQSSVTFHGHVENVRQMMRRSDLVVIPSRFDSFPNVGLEAMEVGTPFIISDLPDVRAAFGRAAEYVPPDNPPQLAEKLSALQQLERYRSLRNRCLAHRSDFDFDWIGEFETELQFLVKKDDPVSSSKEGTVQ